MSVENLSTYTETDPNSKITISGTGSEKVSYSALSKQESAYVYKDFGANHFDALDVDFEGYVNSDSQNWGLSATAISNTISTIAGFATTDVALECVKNDVGSVISTTVTIVSFVLKLFVVSLTLTV